MAKATAYLDDEPARRTEKIAESVARQILREIRRNGLAPGARLPSEAVMLERLQIGRGSLREALRILEINGLVTIKSGPGGGPVLAPPDPRNFGQISTLHLQSINATYRQLLEARGEYESMLARRAASQDGDEAAKAVRQALEMSDQLVSDDSRFGTVTTGFHWAVCDAGGNPVLALAAKSIQSIWAVHITSVLFGPADRPRVQRDHEAITRAIEAHDAKRAERLMREHQRR
jgi:GntR family transcriptional regulator, transcriptional repressor for pyruvate dehydrogenase complex